MMATEAMQELLDEIKYARQHDEESNHVRQHDEERSEHNKVWRLMHTLAEAQFPPAFEYFVELLHDSDWLWRLDALECLGFHYLFPPDGTVAAQIRHLLLTDQEGYGLVRMAAASILGIRSTWPDAALETALQTDADDDVRRAAFAALLTLGGVSSKIVREEEQRAQVGESQPTLDEVQRILTKLNM